MLDLGEIDLRFPQGHADFGALSVGWFDGLTEILVLVKESGNWPDHLLEAFFVMIPKEGGDATPIGQIPWSVLPIVNRFWAPGLV